MNETQVLDNIMKRPVPEGVGLDSASDPKRQHSESKVKQGMGIMERTERFLKGENTVNEEEPETFCELGAYRDCFGTKQWVHGGRCEINGDTYFADPHHVYNTEEQNALEQPEYLRSIAGGDKDYAQCRFKKLFQEMHLCRDLLRIVQFLESKAELYMFELYPEDGTIPKVSYEDHIRMKYLNELITEFRDFLAKQKNGYRGVP